MHPDPAPEPARPTSAGQDAPGGAFREWRLPLVLLALTLLTTLWSGAALHGLDPLEDPRAILAGWDFSLPLLAILVTHELGHYVAGRLHGVDVSPPYFIPLPPPLGLGTMGAVIRIRSAITDRRALLDVGAAGPLAGLAVALPVLAVGLAASPVEPLPPPGGGLIAEGHSILYEAMLRAILGPFPEGHDVMLTPTAFAGWMGLLVTMMNLLPFSQLDGGHIAFALLGPRQHRIGRAVLFALPLVATVTGGYFGARALARGLTGDPLLHELLAGVHWLVWFGVLLLLGRLSGFDHPPSDHGTLGLGRKAVAVACLVLFALLFMPSWMRDT